MTDHLEKVKDEVENLALEDELVEAEAPKEIDEPVEMQEEPVAVVPSPEPPANEPEKTAAVVEDSMTELSTTETEAAAAAAAEDSQRMAALASLANLPTSQTFEVSQKVSPRKSGFWVFAKKYSTEDLMQWGTKRIPDGSLTEQPEDLTNIASDAFEDLLRIMGDKKGRVSSNKPAADLILKLIERGQCNFGLRDELYLQLIKQLTKNPSVESQRRGWEVLCCYVTVFPPSIPMDQWVLGWVARARDADPDDRIRQMAGHAHKKLKRLCQVGPKGRIPKIEEVERAIIAPFQPSPFGETLEEIMANPDLVDPERPQYPRILIFLSEAVVKLNGCSTEGIFRVPGDIDGVTALKLKIENGQYELGESIRDPSIPASLLKLWLRELAEPLIPSSLYETCIHVRPDDAPTAIALLDALPKVNLAVAKYLIKYLQIFANPQFHTHTKMNVANLAMVFAPNFLRCPSENPLTILTNSRLEQNYIKTLINYLED